MNLDRILLLALWVTPALAAETIPLEVVRPDGTKITAYLDTPDEQSKYPLVLFCQGSEAVTVAPKFLPWIARLEQAGVAALRVEKPGLKADSNGANEEYLRLNCLSRRVLDNLEVLAHLERTRPAWNGELAVLGGSEGGEVATQVAALQSPGRLKSVVAVVSASGKTFQESLVQSIDNPPRPFLEALNEVRQKPVWSQELGSDGKTARNTYKWWAEALDVETCLSLDKVKCPIMVIHGDKDPFTPPEVEPRLRERFQEKSFHYVRVAGCSHDIAAFPQGERAIVEALDWMIKEFRP